MKIFKSTKIIYQLLAAFALIGLVPLLVSSDNLIQLTRSELRYSLKESHTDKSSDTSRQIAEKIQTVFNELGMLSQSLVRLLAISTQRQEVVQTLLDSFVEGSDHLDQLALRTLDFEIITASRKKVRASKNFREALLSNANFSNVAEGGVFISPLFTQNDSANLKITIGFPVANLEGPLGALFAEVNLEGLRKLMQGKSFGAEGQSYAVNSMGMAFAHSERELGHNLPDYSAREPVQAVLQRTANGATHYKDEKGRDILVAYSPIPNPQVSNIEIPLNWGVLVEEPTEHAYDLVSSMTRQSRIFVIVTILLACLVAGFLAFRISSPIRLLTAGAKQFGEGHLEKRIELHHRNELGTLAKTFNQMASSVEEYTAKLKMKAEEMRQLFLQSVGALAAAIDAKDPYTRGHSQRVAVYSRQIALEIGLNQEDSEEVYLSGLLHDVGKVGIPDAVLNKPGPLTADEYEIMKQHPVLGAKIMCQIQALDPIIPGMLQHHERWDGTGYPEGLKGEEISLAARIIGIADTFDAMTTNRPYQKKMTDDVAINIIRGLSGKRFDPELVDAFLRAYIQFEKTEKVDLYEVLGYEEAKRAGLAAHA